MMAGPAGRTATDSNVADLDDDGTGRSPTDSPTSHQCARPARSETLFGLDKVKLTFPIDRDLWFRRNIRLRGACLALEARGSRGWVEWNPSRIGDPGGRGLVSVNDALRVAPDVWAATTAHLPAAVALDAARVSRLDLARDFVGSSDPGAIIAHHAHPDVLPRYVRRDPAMYFDRKTGQPNYVRVGGKNDHVVLYKKKNDAILRFEIRAHRGWLQASGISEFRNITAGLVDNMGRKYWNWFAGGAQVVLMNEGPPEGSIYQQVTRLAKFGSWTTQKRASVLQIALDAAHGYPLNWRQRQALQAALEAGLVIPRAPLEAADQPLVEFLNLESGTVEMQFAGMIS